VADELDFVPMDRFQVANWKRRRDGQEAYAKLLLPLKVTQGALSDPAYFDYVTSVQLSTISELMKKGEQVFTEATGADGVETVVRRDARLADNALLPEAYAVRLGDRLFQALRDGFEDEAFGGPSACTSLDWGCTVAGARTIVGLLVSRGFAFGGALTDENETQRTFRVRLEGAATLYAAADSAARGVSPPPAFAEYAMSGFFRASGWTPSVATRASRSAFDMVWTLR
jgi:hypothetical protein